MTPDQERREETGTEIKPAHSSECAVELDFLDAAVIRITPVHSLGGAFERQTVRPEDVRKDENLPMRSVHPCFLYPPSAVVRLALFPVCPVHPAAHKSKILQKHTNHVSYTDTEDFLSCCDYRLRVNYSYVCTHTHTTYTPLYYSTETSLRFTSFN